MHRSLFSNGGGGGAAGGAGGSDGGNDGDAAHLHTYMSTDAEADVEVTVAPTTVANVAPPASAMSASTADVVADGSEVSMSVCTLMLAAVTVTVIALS